MKRKIFCLLVVLFCPLICLLEMSDNAVYAATEDSRGIDVILIIDQSGSMSDEHRDKDKQALNMADFFVKNLPAEDLRLGVYSFSTDVYPVFEFQEVSSKRQDKVKIEKIIKSLEYAGDTDMGDAFEVCAKIWGQIKADSDDREQMIVFMTDGDIDFEEGEDDDENKRLMEDSHERMLEALSTIDCTKCPVYVIAFGDEAVDGKDAKEVSQIKGNYFIPARDQATLEDAYNNVFENILGTKAVKKEGIFINQNSNAVSLDNDDSQTGLNVNITTNSDGSGVIVDDNTVIKIRNDETGEIWSLDDLNIEDYTDELLGRLLKIPNDILKEGKLSLIFDTAESDVIDIKEYFLYDIDAQWNTENGLSYIKDETIKLDVTIDGIDTNAFVVYTIFEKVDSSTGIPSEVIPSNIYAGQQVDSVEIYGSALKEEKLITFSGVKALLDTETGCFTTTVTFDEPGNYQVYIYGESEKGFVLSDTLEFSVNEQEKESELGIKDKVLQIIHMLIEKFMSLTIVGKIVSVVGLFVVLRVIKYILSKIIFVDNDEEDDDY